MPVKLVPFHRGRSSEVCRVVQTAARQRLAARDLSSFAPQVDGDCGPSTIRAVSKAAWALGAQLSTVAKIRTTGEVPVGVSRMIVNPGKRTPEQKAIARARMSQMRAQRKRRADAAAKEHADHGTTSRSRAVNAFLAKVGTVERPPGSNGGGIITVMESYWGFGRVAWCGISAGYHAKKFGGVEGLRSDVASVWAIENHARRGDGPYGRWVSDVSDLLPGSLIVIGGSGVHVGMKVDDAPAGGAETVEGNTSFGPGGSQSDGGCIAHRFRSDAEIFGGAAMDYPN